MQEPDHGGEAARALPAVRKASTVRDKDKWRLVRRVAPFVLVALSVVLLRRELPAAARALAHARPFALVSIVLFFVWNHVASLAWRGLLRASGASKLRIESLARLRIEAQAVNQIVPAAGMAGEGMRTVRAAGPGEIGASSLATVLDNVAGTLSGLVFSVGALGLHLQAEAGKRELRAITVTTAVALVLLMVAVALPFQLGHKLVARLAPSGRLRRILVPFADRRLVIRRAFRDAVALRFVERLLGAGEVYIAFAAVGAPISVADAALITAVFIVVSFTVFFLPGQLGAAEAAVTTASALLGIPPALGLSAALLRRARQLVVCAIGLVSILVRRQQSLPVGSHHTLEKAG